MGLEVRAGPAAPPAVQRQLGVPEAQEFFDLAEEAVERAGLHAKARLLWSSRCLGPRQELIGDCASHEDELLGARLVLALCAS
eukprot:4838018-Pyramimonas_sp.AAC.1